ncbi:MAG: hypothetical protein AAF387_12775, partial [Pseudomonadota bacterium]
SEVVKGGKVGPIDAGKANGWGIYNYLGNVQELTAASGQWYAMGGSFGDDIAKCEIDNQKPHLGSADSLTGFRVLREIDH